MPSQPRIDWIKCGGQASPCSLPEGTYGWVEVGVTNVGDYGWVRCMIGSGQYDFVPNLLDNILGHDESGVFAFGFTVPSHDVDFSIAVGSYPLWVLVQEAAGSIHRSGGPQQPTISGVYPVWAFEGSTLYIDILGSYLQGAYLVTVQDAYVYSGITINDIGTIVTVQISFDPAMVGLTPPLGKKGVQVETPYGIATARDVFELKERPGVQEAEVGYVRIPRTA